MNRLFRRIAALTTAAVLVVAGAAVAQKPPKPEARRERHHARRQAQPAALRGLHDPQRQALRQRSRGKTVTLEADPYPFADNGFAAKGTKTTDNNGTFSFAQAPGLNTRYRVVASTTPKVTSPVVTVTVAYAVGLTVSDSTPRRGQSVRFHGSVGPRKDGSTAFIQKRRSDGRYVTVARATLVAGTATRSVYSKRLAIRSSGTYRVRVSGDASHAAGTSRTRTLTVH